jgi:ATP-binding cassette subfamily F protein 3
MSSFDVASILGQHLSALDDDVRDYLVSVVADMSADERKSGAALNEAIGPFLLDGGCVESEEAAEILCKTISISFGGSGFKSAIVVEEEQVSLLSAPIKMIDRSGLSKTPKATYGGTVISTFDEDGQLVEVNHNTTLDASVIATTQRQVRRNRKENDRLNKILRGEELARMNAEAEMSAARMAAIKANRTAGRQASMGVNIERFSIPHPSGSSDLLTDASLTLASGHRYGMVGKNGAGKSTLMRQLANYKLEGLMHLRILLVDQHVEGDDQSALQWVLRADVERTALLEDEKRLIECQHDSSVIPRDLRVSTFGDSTHPFPRIYIHATYIYICICQFV